MAAEAKWIVDSWAEELIAVLQFLTGEDWTASVRTPESGSAPVGYFWWTQKFDLAPEARLAVGAPVLAWNELGARVLRSAGVELIEQASSKSTYLEAVQQSENGIARVLSEKSGKVVEPTTGGEEAPSSSEPFFEAVFSTGGVDLPAIRVVVSEELCSALQPSVKMLPSSENSAPVLPASGNPAPLPADISVLLDVQMPVSICFGRASMALRDVMKLTSGSAVELDRRPGDEVDIIVNNCVIARGEVVAIEGNYGVRVTAIISREQRLALQRGVR